MNIKTETRNNNEAPIIENLSITWNSISLSITPNPFYPVTTITENGTGKEWYRGNGGNVTINNLTRNRMYSWEVVGLDPIIGQTKSFMLNFSTLDRKKPTPVDYLDYYDLKPGSVSFFWHGGTVDGGTAKYEIKRDAVLLDTPLSPPYIDTTPAEGRNHTYCIRTFDDELSFSDPVCVEVYFEDLTKPTDPTNLVTSSLALTLSWEESYDSSGTIRYLIDQGIGNDLGTTVETQFAVDHLEADKRYEFGVTAEDPTGNKSNRVMVHYPPLGVPFKGKR